MNFKTWIVQYTKEDTPRGDLARDIRDDKTFPEDYTDPDRIESYIHCRNVLDSSAACKVLRRVWKQYIKANPQ